MITFLARLNPRQPGSPQSRQTQTSANPERGRAYIEHVRCELKVSERRVCLVLGQHRSTQRLVPTGRDGTTSTANLSTDLTTALTSASFIAAAAAVVTMSGTGAGAGIFLVINDNTAGFQSASDVVIKLEGTMTLASSNFSV